MATHLRCEPRSNPTNTPPPPRHSTERHDTDRLRPPTYQPPEPPRNPTTQPDNTKWHHPYLTQPHNRNSTRDAGSNSHEFEFAPNSHEFVDPSEFEFATSKSNSPLIRLNSPEA